LRTERIGGAGQDAGQDARHAGGPAGSTLWLIARDAAAGRSEPPREPLLVDEGGGRGGEALAVFGHEEEAEMYLGLWAPGDDGWRAREIGAGELASLLRGPSWPGARRVALDPLPGALSGAAGFDLLLLAGMDRDRFAQRLARDARDARRRRG
jgi:hypothetical protein